jgi:acyl-CoA synthetase (AMP-forming)/AMP-acid ligase II
MKRLSTLPSILRERADKTPERTALRVAPRGAERESWSFGDLHRESIAVAARIRGSGIREGERVMIMLPTSLEFASCFFGASLAGRTPVPVCPPTRLRRMTTCLHTLGHILNNVDPRVILVPEGLHPSALDGLDERAGPRRAPAEGTRPKPLSVLDQSGAASEILSSSRERGVRG